MLYRTIVRLFLLALLSTTLLSGPAAAATCAGVERAHLVGGGWTTDLIQTDGGQPLVVEVVAKYIDGGMTVEFFDGTAWHTMSQGVTVEASAVRYRGDGEAGFRLDSGTCNDDWTTSDDA
jgi:hypothetical protein